MADFYDNFVHWQSKAMEYKKQIKLLTSKLENKTKEIETLREVIDQIKGKLEKDDNS